MDAKFLGGGIARACSRVGDSSSSIKKVGGGFAGLATVLLLLFLLLSPAAAMAGSVTGNTAYNDSATNIEDQTIVGEGQNNNVIITNITTDVPSPTGIFMANLPIFIIGAFVVAGAVVVVARARKKAGENDE